MLRPTRAQAAKEMCRIGRSLFNRGYVHATAGNLSVRLDDGVLITPTDACLGRLHPGELAWVDAAGVQRDGLPASKSVRLHCRIYDADPAAGAIVHTHSTHLVAMTLCGVWNPADILPPITPYYVMKVGHVPLVPYHRPGDPAVGDQVVTLMGQSAKRGSPLRAVMLDRLGPQVWPRTLGEAAAVLEELEETARLWVLAGRTVSALPQARLDELRAAFGACW